LAESFPQKLARWTLRHLQLAGFSLLLSVIVGIPLGIIASRGGLIGHAILGFTGVVQTIPSLALLALLVPLPFFGINARTAIAALFLYGLLPIVRNTASGLQDIPRSLRESAIALGLSPITRLWEIYLPMASRSILSGIKTSAVINRSRRPGRADLERPQPERSRNDPARRDSSSPAGAVGTMVFRFARSRSNSKRAALVTGTSSNAGHSERSEELHIGSWVTLFTQRAAPS